MCVFVYICMHVRMYVYTHTHTLLPMCLKLLVTALCSNDTWSFLLYQVVLIMAHKG